MTQATHPTLVKTLCKSICGIALPILLASCGGGDSPAPKDPTPTAPILDDVSAQTYTAEQTIATLPFTNSGGGDLLEASGCTVSPKLPIGLVLSKTTDNQNCQITGTPAMASNQATYTITATNATGSDATMVSITVSAAASVNPVSITNVELKSTEARTTPLAEDVLTLTFETTGQISFDPQVMIGNQLASVAQGDTAGDWIATITVVEGEFQSTNEGFVVIVVVPQGISSTENLSQSATVTAVQNTATSLDLTGTATFPLTPILTLETTNYSFAVDQLITPIIFTNAGGNVAADGCGVNTPLPQGLNLNASGTTCEIRGTPEMATDSGDYIITATNATGEGTFTITAIVNKGTDTLSFRQSVVSAAVGDAPSTPQTASGGKGSGMISYKSGDTDVATVDANGEVTIVGAGISMITATRASDANYLETTARYTLTVNDPSKQNDTLSFAATVTNSAVKVSADGTMASVDYVASLSFTRAATSTSGMGTITYTSDNTDTATVVQGTGEVTLVGVGTTMITATRASDATYNQAIASYTLIVTPAVPATPTITAPSTSSLTVNWLAVSGATSYEIYRDNTKIHTTSSGSTITYIDSSGLSPNTGYTYELKACNSGGCSALSTAVSATTPMVTPVTPDAPAVPATPTITVPSVSSLTVNWLVVSGATSYEIYRGGTKTHTTSSGSTITYIDSSGLSPNTGYTYTIKACNVGGCSALSASVSGTTLAPLAIPAAPAMPTITAPSVSSLTVNWLAVSGATSYEIYRGGTKITTINSGSTTTYIDSSGLSPNTGYTYTIKACNVGGCSALSASVSGTTLAPLAIPVAPVAPTITVPSVSSLTVNWLVVSGATSYEIYRDDTKIHTTSSGSTITYIDSSGLSPNTGYTYTIKACNVGGCSALSASVSGTTLAPLAIPVAPVAPTITVPSVSSLTVNWLVVSGATSYEIYRDNTKIHTTSSGSTITYIDSSGLSPNTGYTYTIKACNVGGCSALSNPVSATTLIADCAGDTATICTIGISASQPETISPIGDVDYYRLTPATNGMLTVHTIGDTDTLGSLRSSSDNLLVEDDDNGIDNNFSFSYIVTGGTIYYIRVTEFGSDAIGSYTLHTSFDSNLTTLTVPATPMLMALSSSSIEISWSRVTGATSYEIYRNSAKIYTTFSGSTTTYTDIGLSPDTEYTYTLNACDSVGCSAWSAPASETTPMLPAVPVAPMLMALSSSSIEISWSRVTGAIFYEIYRGRTKIHTTSLESTTTYTDSSGLSPNTGYAYTIKACDAGGCSALSPAASGTTTPVAPATPMLTVLSSSSIEISWSRVTGAIFYEIYRGRTKIHTTSLESTTTYTDSSGLSPNTGYAYTIKACDAGGCSALSPAASGTTTPVAPATPMLTVLSSSSIEISWSRVTGATSYEIYRNSTKIHTTSLESTTTYIDSSGLSPNTGYTYTIKACNSGGCSALSAPASATTTPEAPDAPTLTVLSSSSIEISWDMVTGATSYEIYRNDTKTHTTSSGSTTTYTDSSGLSSNTGYTYTIKACNSGGCSALSAPASATTTPEAPATPMLTVLGSFSIEISWSRVTGATSYEIYRNSTKIHTTSLESTTTYIDSSGLSPNTGYAYTINACNVGGCSALSAPASATTTPEAPATPTLTVLGSFSIEISWDMVTGATSYEIYRGGTEITTINSGSTITYTDASLSPGTGYTYTIKACNSGGCSALSASASATTLMPPAVPDAPTLTVLSSSSIEISWNIVMGAIFYEIYRGGTLVFTTSSGSTTTYTDSSGLLPNTEYTYTINACSNGGCSALSAPASATTLTPPISISNATELGNIGVDDAFPLSGRYILTGNIDLPTIESWTPIGNAANKFTGNFDGGGFEISGLSSSGHQSAGLFGYVEGASISNLGILAGNISASSASASDVYAGGLVGFASGSQISDSYAEVTGGISSTSSHNPSISYAGGLVGRADNSSISNSYANVAGAISSSNDAGGLIGRADNSPIRNSYAAVSGTISSPSDTGGLVGEADGSSISNSYADVGEDISSSNNAGGLVGRARNNSPISNSYANVAGNVSASNDAGGLVGEANGSPISNSYTVVMGNVSASSGTGGLVGRVTAGSSVSASYYSARREGEEVFNSTTDGISKTVAELKEPMEMNLSGSIYADWTAFYDADSMPDAHALITDTTNTAFATGDRRAWHFGDAQQLPTLNPSPVAVSNADLPLYRARQHFVATISGAMQIDLSWSSAGGNYTRYDVYRHMDSDSSGAVKIGSSQVSAGRTYADADLAMNLTYYYWLKACNASDVCSDFFTHQATPYKKADVLTFPKSDLTVVFGDVTSITTQMVGGGNGTGAITYKSSDITVATVDASGIVSIVSAGTTTITATRTTDANYREVTARYILTAVIPTPINTMVGLNGVRDNLGGYYVLAANIDLSSITSWEPIGDEADKFTGNFDGQGFEISGLSSSGSRYTGLFGYVEGANISNLGVMVGDISSTAPSSVSDAYSGGLVGRAINSQISNVDVVVEGNISAIGANSSFSSAGGLAGGTDNSQISNSYAVVEGDISAPYTGGLVGRAIDSQISNVYADIAGNISAVSHAGGLVGFAQDSPISNSYADIASDISSSSAVSSAGGLVGSVRGRSISNSYAVVLGGISSSTNAGGLVGQADENNQINNSYAVVLGAISASSNAGGLFGRAISGSSSSNSYYSASRKSSENEGNFNNTRGTFKTVIELKEPIGLSGSIYAEWTAFYDASSTPAHALITDGVDADGVSVSFVDAADRRVWYFGDAQQLPTLNPSPMDVADGDLPLYRARQHFVATASSAAQIDLSWSSAGDDLSYEVYRHMDDESSSATRIATPMATEGRTYMDMDASLEAGTTYYYRLKACPADTMVMCSDFFAHTQATTQ